MIPELVVLVGPPGAGKTTVAGMLAEQLGVAARDTDEDITKATGRTVAEIFVEDGEPRFRELEREAVAAALAEHAGVLALGGGSILSEHIRTELADRYVVFLDVGIADAARRVGFNRDRPLLLGNPRAQWLKLMEQRRPLYEGVATVTIDTEGRGPEDVTAELVRQLSREPSR